nr:MAG TPA: hypothetical protein [Caudoviricetes sp.]
MPYTTLHAQQHTLNYTVEAVYNALLTKLEISSVPA